MEFLAAKEFQKPKTEQKWKLALNSFGGQKQDSEWMLML